MDAFDILTDFITIIIFLPLTYYDKEAKLNKIDKSKEKQDIKLSNTLK